MPCAFLKPRKLFTCEPYIYHSSLLFFSTKDVAGHSLGLSPYSYPPAIVDSGKLVFSQILSVTFFKKKNIVTSKDFHFRKRQLSPILTAQFTIYATNLVLTVNQLGTRTVLRNARPRYVMRPEQVRAVWETKSLYILVQHEHTVNK